MKNKKKKLLWPISNCCLKKFIDLDNVAKYGSISVIFIILVTQLFNVIMNYNFGTSLLSLFINIFFLVIVLKKVGILKLNISEQLINNILKFMIFIFLLNLFAYSVSNIPLHNYFYAPLSFLGTYFIFILLTSK